MHRWVDVGAQGGGLACISDVTYAYDLSDGRLRLTVLRSPRWADHGAPWPHDRGIEPSHTDQGTHRVSLLLMPHAGDWASAGVPRRAEEHCTNFRAVTETWHESGPRPQLSRRDRPTRQRNGARTKTGRGRYRLGSPGCRGVRPAGSGQLTIEGLGRTWNGTLAPFEVKTLLFPDGAASDTFETDIPELRPWK